MCCGWQSCLILCISCSVLSFVSVCVLAVVAVPMGLFLAPHFRPHHLSSDLFAVAMVLDIKNFDAYPEGNFAAFVVQSFQSVNNELNDLPNGSELLEKGAQLYEPTIPAVYAQIFFAVPKLGDFDMSEIAIGAGALVGTSSMQETRSLAKQLEERIRSDSDTRNLLSDPVYPVFVRAIHLPRGTPMVSDRLKWKFFPAILFTSLFQFPTIEEAVKLMGQQNGVDQKKSTMGCFAAQVCIYHPPDDPRTPLKGIVDLMMFIDEPDDIERLRQTLRDDHKHTVEEKANNPQNDTKTPQRIVSLPHDDEF